MAINLKILHSSPSSISSLTRLSIYPPLRPPFLSSPSFSKTRPCFSLRNSIRETRTNRPVALCFSSSAYDFNGEDRTGGDDFIVGRDIHGRIYINEQGINAQYSGPRKDAMAYVEFLKEDSRFSDLLVQISPTLNAHAFPRLKLRYKPSLVQLEGGMSHLPLIDPAMRAIPLTPSQWRAKLQNRRNFDDLKSSDSNSTNNTNSKRDLLLLDVRNGYEWDIGHFKGSERPNVDCFRSTSFGLSEQKEVESEDPLSGIDKENTDILMYCTGGIRCDVYSIILRDKGFRNLYTLSGGVSNYLKNEGPAEWVGNLFVFDSRLSLPPAKFKPNENTEGKKSLVKNETSSNSSSTELGRCYICGSHLQDLRHRNCANLDCNHLFLCCDSCVKELRGCCGSVCTDAPRLRPVLPGHQRYEKWHIYRDRTKILQENNNLT